MSVPARRNLGLDLNHIIEAVLQKPSCVIQLSLQHCPLRVILTAFLIHAVQAFLEFIYGFFRYPFPQRGLQIIFIQGKNVILQAVIMVEIHFCDYNVVQIISPCKSQPHLVGRNRLCQLDQIIFPPVGIRPLEHYRIFRVNAVGMLFVIIVDRYLAIGSNILRLCKGNIAHLIIVIQGK